MAARTCQYCGATVSAEARYCDRCGTPLQAGVPRPRRQRPPARGRVAIWAFLLTMLVVFMAGTAGGYRYVAGHWQVWERPTLAPGADGPDDPLLVPSGTPNRPDAPDEAVSAYLRSVVGITANGTDGNKNGSGFLFAPGAVLTNAHVVERVQCVTVTDDDGTMHQGQVVGYDRSLDVALVTVPTLKAWTAQLPLGTGEMPQVGDDMWALGSPKGGRPAPLKLSVSQLNQSFTVDSRAYHGMLMLNGDPVQEGTSGGPVVAAKTGKVMGIVTASDRSAYAYARPLDAGLQALIDGWRAQQKIAACEAEIVGPTVDLTLAAVLPLTGPDWMVGADLADGAELALRDLEADLRKVGYNVKLQRHDDQGDTRLTTSLASDLASDQQVVGVVGSLNSNTTHALASTLKGPGTAVVAPLANADDLTQNGWRHFSRVVGSARSQELAVAQFAAKLQLKNVLVVHDGTDQAQKEANTFEGNAGNAQVDVVGQVAFTTYADLKQALRSRQAQAIYLAGSAQLAAEIATLLWQDGAPYPIVGTSELYAPARFQKYAHRGVFFTYLTAAPSEQFARRFEFVMGHAPRGYAAYGYDAAWTILDALRRYGEEHPGQAPSRVELTEEIRRTDHTGWSAKLKFDQRGENITAWTYLYEWRSGAAEMWDALPNGQ